MTKIMFELFSGYYICTINAASIIHIIPSVGFTGTSKFPGAHDVCELLCQQTGLPVKLRKQITTRTGL